MNASLAFLVGGAVVALVVAILWMRSRRRTTPADPISATTGSNRSLTGSSRTLTGALPGAGQPSVSFNEALRLFAAYALDDAPREALSREPNPEHAPVFKAVQQILERIEGRPEHIPRRPNLLPRLLATVNDNEATMAQMSQIIAQDPALTGNLL